MRLSREARVLALASLGIVGLLAYRFAGQQVGGAEQELRPMEGGSAHTPVVGVLLSEKPRVHVQLRGEEDLAPPGTVGVPFEQAATFSSDWRAVAFTQSTADEEGAIRTRVLLPSGSEVELDGLQRAQPVDANFTLVVAERSSQDGLFSVRLLDARGGIHFELQSEEPSWVEATAEGELVAIGSLRGTSVSARDGEKLVVGGQSSLGALSRRWLATERELEGRHELVLHGLGGGAEGEHAFPVERGAALHFDGTGRHLVHVGQKHATLYVLDPAPRMVGSRALDGDSRWSAAAFDAQGRLALSWIDVEQPQRAVESGTDAGRVRGRATVGVELLDAAAPEAKALDRREWKVQQWSGTSPEIAFDVHARLLARVWPLSYEVFP